MDQFPENPSGFGGGGITIIMNRSIRLEFVIFLERPRKMGTILIILPLAIIIITTTINNEIQENRGYQSHRAKISMLSSRPSVRENHDKPLSSNSVPKLDSTKTDFGEPVSYQVSKGPPGLSIPIVRTGGQSQYSK
jgi:hypothetical protein